MEFLQNLERLMASKNMNRSEVARACGLSTSTVNSWWNRGCDNISLQTLLKLSKSFNCSIEELVHGEPELSFIYTTNEFTIRELKLIKLYATFLKTIRKDGGDNGI
jgi:DNA-binding Xre family transcriptional regulator